MGWYFSDLKFNFLFAKIGQMENPCSQTINEIGQIQSAPEIAQINSSKICYSILIKILDEHTATIQSVN